MESPADYRLTPAADEAAELAFQLAEMAYELTYERQMRQQTEEAMIKLGRRVSEQQAELSEQEAAKLELVKENLEWRVVVDELRNANFRLEKEADKNYAGYRFS